jgi:hypothetical protein
MVDLSSQASVFCKLQRNLVLHLKPIPAPFPFLPSLIPSSPFHPYNFHGHLTPIRNMSQTMCLMAADAQIAKTCLCLNLKVMRREPTRCLRTSDGRREFISPINFLQRITFKDNYYNPHSRQTSNATTCGEIGTKSYVVNGSFASYLPFCQ